MSYGYVYLGYGPKHFKEGILSARRLREVDPVTPISIYTDAKYPQFDEYTYIFDNVVVLEGWSPEEIKLKGKVLGLGSSPYDITICFDTDSWFVSTPVVLFDLLKNFDMLVVPDPAEPEIEEEIVVSYSSSLVGWNKNERTTEFFRVYKETYEADDFSFHPDRKRKTDQPAYTLALIESNVRFFVLDQTWNARARFFSSFSSPIKLIHGPTPEMGWEELARRFNSYTWNRSWNPFTQQMYTGKDLSASMLMKVVKDPEL